MSTRAEKEKQKAQQEKFQAILSSLLKDEDNKYCVDCDAKGPRWASWNLGLFLCIRCAGIHRNLGVHISKVKSVNLDTWTAEQIAMMMEIGNSRARAAYEANLPDNYKRPQTDSALESFIRAKYESKKYLAREWVQPKPSVPRELKQQLVEDDKDKRKSKPKASGSLQLASMPRSQSGPAINTQGQANKGESKATEKNTLQTKTTPVSSASAVDLIGLVFEASPAPDNNNTGGVDAPTSSISTSNNLLGDLNDFMGSAPQSAPSSQPNTQTGPQNQMSNGSLEANLFGETATSTAVSEPKTSTKDSILALYGGQQTQQQFGVPGGMYMPPQQQQQHQQQQQQNMGVMYGMQPQQQPQQMGMQQQGMYANQMGMMGMQGSMGMPAQQGMMGNMGQQGMQMAPNNIAMYNQQQQSMQQMQFQQMQQQMAGMSMTGQPASGPMGGMNQGWGTGQTSGHTLSTNLWQ